MKKCYNYFVTVCSVFILILKADAQIAPQYAKTTVGSSASINFMANANYVKFQQIYEPGDLTGTKPLKSGTITRLYFKSSTVEQSATFTDLRIFLKQAKTKVFPGTDSLDFFTNLDTVYFRPEVLIKGSLIVNGWFAIELDKPYLYDSSQSLIVELQYSDIPGGEIRTLGSASPTGRAHKKMYAGSVSAVKGTASGANWQDMGIDINTSYNNASVRGLVAPFGFCAGNQDIIVRIKNTGRNVLNNVTINWTLDNLPQPPVSWTSQLDTMGGTLYRNDTAVLLGNVSFGIPSRKIKVWTEYPNSTADITTDDDTLVFTVKAGLTGAYSIGGSSADYLTPGAAVADLNNYGICGPVTFNVTSGSGPYAESIALNNIKGVSSTNTILFKGNGTSLSNSVSPIVSLTGVSYITFDSLNIVTPSTYAGTGIYIGKQSHHITLTRNRINLGITSTSSAAAGIAISGDKEAPATAGDNAQYVTISNNEIIGGYYSIILMGTAGYFNNYGHQVINNICRDFYSYGIYLANADTVTVSGNNINRATRTSFTTFNGIYMTTSRNLRIQKNRIHHAGTGSYSANPFSINNCVNTAGYETEISNNLVYSNNTSGAFNAINCATTATNGFRFYYNTMQHNIPSGSSAARGANFSVAMTNLVFRNNIISITGAGTGIKTGIYVSATSTGLISNNNVIHLAASGTNNTGYWTTARLTLADWKTASLQDTNSVSSDPVFTDIAAGNFIPTSSSVDNIGAIVSVTEDILGTPRLSIPDPGAFEFSGLIGDVSIESGSLKRSGICYSLLDTVFIGVKNLIGNNIDFGMVPLNIVWNVTGPVNSGGVITISSGILNTSASATYFANSVDMTKPGNYTLTAYIQSSMVNVITSNDTLAATAPFTVEPLFFAAPKTATVNSAADTVVLKAGSPFFPPQSSIFFSELCYNKNLTASIPAGGWPAYLKAADYLEITSFPNTDLAGYTLEEWSGTALKYSYTFPFNTLFSPGGTMIVAIGELNSSTPSPADFYYHSGNTADHLTSQSWGYIMRSPTGEIVDAMAHRAFTFPAAAGITTVDWSGTTNPSIGSGMRLTGPDNNNSSCWSPETPSGLQNPNALNANVPPAANTTVSGLQWTYLGAPVSTERRTVAGPYTVPGTYIYAASYTHTCGTFYDTVLITASASVPVKLISFTARKNNEDVLLNWSTASEINNSYFEVQRSTDHITFEHAGTVKGQGTLSRISIYSFEDAGAFSNYNGILYYRLKQVDRDGRSELSHTVSVVQEQSKATYIIGPNPFTTAPILHISDMQNNTKATITISDIKGAMISKRMINLHEGDNDILLDEIQREKGGVYFVTISGDKEVIVKRIVKL